MPEIQGDFQKSLFRAVRKYVFYRKLGQKNTQKQWDYRLNPFATKELERQKSASRFLFFPALLRRGCISSGVPTGHPQNGENQEKHLQFIFSLLELPSLAFQVRQ